MQCCKFIQVNKKVKLKIIAINSRSNPIKKNKYKSPKGSEWQFFTCIKSNRLLPHFNAMKPLPQLQHWHHPLWLLQPHWKMGSKDKLLFIQSIKAYSRLVISDSSVFSITTSLIFSDLTRITSIIRLSIHRSKNNSINQEMKKVKTNLKI